jgi:predicted metalloenzyme YecM
MNPLNNYIPFLDQIFANLKQLNLQVKDLELDHLAYQTSSTQEYENLLPQILEKGNLASESIVGNRRVAIIKLNSPLLYQSRQIQVIELIEPKTGHKCHSGLEHAEFVLNCSFDEFLKKYPQIPWDLSAKHRPEFPKLQLKFPDGTGVKFHPQHILKEII